MIAQTPNVLTLPTQDELPSDDGIPMESQRHKLQMDLLIYPLIPWLKNQEDGYVGGNMKNKFIKIDSEFPNIFGTILLIQKI